MTEQVIKDWFKSSASTGYNNCVEVRVLGNRGVEVRHSQDPKGPTIQFTRDEWNAFLEGVHKGEFDID